MAATVVAEQLLAALGGDGVMTLPYRRGQNACCCSGTAAASGPCGRGGGGGGVMGSHTAGGLCAHKAQDERRRGSCKRLGWGAGRTSREGVRTATIALAACIYFI